MTDLTLDAIVWFNWFVLGYFLVLNSSYLVLIAVAAVRTTRELRRPMGWRLDDVFADPFTPGISIVIPAYDEEVCVVASVRGALGLRYPKLEVVVVDDGSTDGTFDVLQREFDLVEVAPVADHDLIVVGAVRSMHTTDDGMLTVVRKANAQRRSDAVNAGVNVARHELVCCVDADSVLEEDALLHVVRPFVDDPERTIATGGSIRAVNGSSVYRGQLGERRQPRNWLVRIQIVEYLRSFLLGRTGWSQAGALLIISGAFGLYRRDALIAVGGFDPDCLGEDFDVVMALHHWSKEQGIDGRLVFVAEANCWTEVPPTRQVLARQRRRWSHGLAQVLWKHRSMIGRPRYGPVGTLGLPYWIAFELLGPIVELTGVVMLVLGLWLGVVDSGLAILVAAAALLYGLAVSVAAILVEELTYHRYRRWRDVGSLVVASAVENVGFRQWHAWCRLRGLCDAVRRSESTWGRMERSGFVGDTFP